jgi:ABC-type polysaccharide/polyol phosphate export permease
MNLAEEMHKQAYNEVNGGYIWHQIQLAAKAGSYSLVWGDSIISDNYRDWLKGNGFTIDESNPSMIKIEW